MGQLSLTIPTAGSTSFDVAAANVDADLAAIQTWANGNIDQTNVAAALAQSAAVNQSGQTVKGAVNIATSESRANAAYGTMPTPDQVSGIVLPTNGLIGVWYQATWQESSPGGGRAAIFVDGNQLQVADDSGTPRTEAARTGLGTGSGINYVLTTCPTGLVTTTENVSYTGDVTTGQAIGVFGKSAGLGYEIAGAFSSTPAVSLSGGACWIFAAAGTHTVSVQFKANAGVGSVTAQNRKLWIQALSFS